MSKISLYSLLLYALMCIHITPLTLADETVAQSGTATASFRFRVEHISDDAFDSDALATTVRFRLNYSSGEWRRWTGFAELDYVEELITDHYNSGGGTSSADRDGYPVVADPNGADLNQFYADYHGFDDWQVRLGRQRILVDDQRFVGGVGWRQNEQTYDAVSLGYSGWSSVRLNYRYIGQVNRIFGETSDVGRNEVNAHILTGDLRPGDQWVVKPYVVFIKNADITSFSTNTLGVRASGILKFNNRSIEINTSWATQSDVGNNPVSYDAEYLSLSADWALSRKLSLGLGAEILEGDENRAGSAFRTPLATLHKFQGWADKFLTTPDTGIEDYFIGAKYTAGRWMLSAIYHDFSASDGSEQFGSEIDFSASRTFNKRFAVLAKAAVFNSDSDSYSDTTKLWIQIVTSY